MCVQPTGKSPASIRGLCLLTPQPLFATVLCFHPHGLPALKGILSSTSHADYEQLLWHL